jgi:zinc/manganese transport system substrate-binding protein
MNTIMKTILHSLTLAALILATAATQAKLAVIATTSDLRSLAREIGGDKVDVTTLAKPTEDPHFVDAKPSFIVKLNHADAVVEGGAELEIGWLPPLLEGARNTKLDSGAPGHIACNAGIQLLEIPSTLDRSKGDIHAAGNPHYMMDPANAKIVAQHIADSFCKLDEKNTGSYRANLKKFNDQLTVRLEEWVKKLEPFKGQRVVAYHNSWPYFSERFGVKIDLFLEPKPGLPPTPAHLAEVIAKMKVEKVRAIFVEPHLNRKTADKVSGETGATVVSVAQFPGGVKGTDGGYIPLMDYLVTSLAKALEEKAEGRR